MAKVRSWVGRDVHTRSVLAVSIDGETGELSSLRLSGITAEVVKFCSSLPGLTLVVCEAGPTGYRLSRTLTRAGMGCSGRSPGQVRAAIQ